jgi:hypothetical protein
LFRNLNLKKKRERKQTPPKLNGWSKRSSQSEVYNNKCVHEEKRTLSDKQPNKEPEK